MSQGRLHLSPEKPRFIRPLPLKARTCFSLLQRKKYLGVFGNILLGAWGKYA